MEKPDWPTRPQITPIETRRTGQQDSDGEAFWFIRTPRIVRLLARSLRDGDITQVYIALAERANAHGVCWPSYDQIADDAGVSRRKAIKVVGILSTAKLVAVSRGRNANEYTLTGRENLPEEGDIPVIIERIQTGDEDVTGAFPAPLDEKSLVQSVHSTGAVLTPSLVQSVHSTGAETAPRTKSKTARTKKSSSDDAGAVEKPQREPTRIYQVAEWYANRVGGVIPGKGAREWSDAKRLAETGITDDELARLFDWLAAQTWVQSLSLGLMANKLNEWRSSEIVANKPQRLVL